MSVSFSDHNTDCLVISRRKGVASIVFSDSMYEVVDKEAGEKLREVLTTEEYEKVLAEGDYQVRMKYFSWLNPYLEKLAEN